MRAMLLGAGHKIHSFKCGVRLKPVLSVLCQKHPVQRGKRSLKFARLIRRKDTLVRMNIVSQEMVKKEHGVCVDKHF